MRIVYCIGQKIFEMANGLMRMEGRQVYVVVTPFFPSPANWRGAYCYDFVKTLKKILDGWRVEVLKPGDGRDYEVDGIIVRTFRTRQLPSNLFPFLFRRRNERSFLEKLKNIRVKIDEVAVCHGHTVNCVIYPLAVKKFNPHCKTLLHHHDPASFGLNNGRLRHCWIYNLHQFLVLRWLHEQIDTHVFISKTVKRSFLSAPNAEWTSYLDYRRQMRGPRFLGFRPVSVRGLICLHNGVDTLIFHPATISHVQSRFTIGCVANFIDWKDQITLLRALTVLRDRGQNVPCVRFVGSGPLLDACKKYTKEKRLSDSVMFESEVKHEQLPEFYHSIDLFVLPSYFEGFGCVFTEAWSCGVPFITCEGQGMDDIVPENERHLWLCRPRDAEDLADKIAFYIRNRPEQHLTESQDIESLVGKFVETVLKGVVG